MAIVDAHTQMNAGHLAERSTEKDGGGWGVLAQFYVLGLWRNTQIICGPPCIFVTSKVILQNVIIPAPHHRKRRLRSHFY